MDLEYLKEFISQLFTQLNSADSWAVLTFLLGSFLFGSIFTWILRGGKIRRFKKALKKKEKEYAVLQAEQNALKEQFDLKEADLKKAQLETEDLRTKNNALEEEVSQVSGNFYAARDQIEKWKLESEERACTIEDLNNQILGLKSKNTQMETTLEETKEIGEQTSTSQTDYDEAFQKLSLFENKLAQLETENKALQSRFDKVQNKVHDAVPTPSEDLTLIKAQLQKLESENTRLNNELASIKSNTSGTDLSGIQAKLAALTTVNSQLQSDLYAIKDTTRTKVVRMAEEEMQEVKNRLVQLEKENKNLYGELEGLKTAETEVEFIEIKDQEVEIEEVNPNEKSNQGRIALKNAFGSKIKLATADEKDDLKKIGGIGPFIEDKLNEIGIYTYEQISQFDDALIENITDAIQFFPGRIKRDDWVGQAKKFAQKS